MDLRTNKANIYSLTRAYGPQPVVLRTEYAPYSWEVDFSIDLWENSGFINGIKFHIKVEDCGKDEGIIWIWS